MCTESTHVPASAMDTTGLCLTLTALGLIPELELLFSHWKAPARQHNLLYESILQIVPMRSPLSQFCLHIHNYLDM